MHGACRHDEPRVRKSRLFQVGQQLLSNQEMPEVVDPDGFLKTLHCKFWCRVTGGHRYPSIQAEHVDGLGPPILAKLLHRRQVCQVTFKGTGRARSSGCFLGLGQGTTGHKDFMPCRCELPGRVQSDARVGA